MYSEFPRLQVQRQICNRNNESILSKHVVFFLFFHSRSSRCNSSLIKQIQDHQALTGNIRPKKGPNTAPVMLNTTVISWISKVSTKSKVKIVILAREIFILDIYPEPSLRYFEKDSIFSNVSIMAIMFIGIEKNGFKAGTYLRLYRNWLSLK